MSEWQNLCASCKNGDHNGGCCACMACRVVPEPVAPLTRVEVEEAINHLRIAYKRGPKGPDWRAIHHQRLNDLLDQRDAAVLEESFAEE